MSYPLPKKSLGQHFLRCRWVISTLIHTAELNPSDTVLEIGPGKGTLTRALAKSAKRVIAVEKDERLAEELEKSLKQEGFSNIEIIKRDILILLKSDFNSIFKWKVIGNIPYYLTSRLLRLLFEHKPLPKLIVLTVQKEVAQRICVKSPHMNLLALSVQAYGKPKIIKTVPPSCFSPKPKVDSAIIKISDISDKFFKDNKISETKFFEVLRTAFSQKRKQLGHTLGLKKIDPLSAARPEELTLEQWAKLVRN